MTEKEGGREGKGMGGGSVVATFTHEWTKDGGRTEYTFSQDSTS